MLGDMIQGIHNASQRVEGPFIGINCGALTETLLEGQILKNDGENVSKK